MESIEWTPMELLGMSGSYWQACTLHTGVKLDLFSLVGNEGKSTEEVASRLGGNVRGVTMILNALAALGLLVKKESVFTNTAFSKQFLVKGSPEYVGYIIMHHKHMVKTWSYLDQAVKSGRPVRKSPENEEEELKSFLLGMFNMAMGIAPDLAKQLDLEGKKHLLDLGGGPGTYAIHFCLENPNLKATIYDLPTTMPYAQKTVEEFGLSDRIDFMAGDYMNKDIKGAYDVAWLSHILHSMGPDSCQTIIDKAVSVMKPGGLLMVHEFILEDTFDSPLFPAIFSLNMLVNTEEGQSYSGGRIIEMFNRAGLKEIRRLPFRGLNDSGIIAGIIG